MKDVAVYFSEEANITYKELQGRVSEQKKKGMENSQEMQLLKAIDREKINLKKNPQGGIHIPKRNIPNPPITPKKILFVIMALLCKKHIKL